MIQIASVLAYSHNLQYTYCSGVFRNLETGGGGGHIDGHKKFLQPFEKLTYVDHFFWGERPTWRPFLHSLSQFSAPDPSKAGGHQPFHLSSNPSKNFPISPKGGPWHNAPPPPQIRHCIPAERILLQKYNNYNVLSQNLNLMLKAITNHMSQQC
jgi:hypothetical protein